MTDAIGAFVIGLLCGATRYRDRIEQLALPMRDVFAAFFFVVSVIAPAWNRSFST
ncbi:hypothetical protein IAE22_34195, partial [Bacillus sp. S34]|nr:hypothetical protein [Bacillus sp. S34]